ncbi:MAG: hypothetical protein HQL42_10550 [Alphaproteobacteria bacterium]|nr:hypothetical protein [Alphaproteobacteria bacterium]
MSGYGGDEDGGYNALSKAYKKDPSLEAYVQLRRNYPDAEIEVSVIGGMDQLFFLEPEIKKYGFDPSLVASVMDADPEAISELSLQIMEKMVEAKKISRNGATHLSRRCLAIPDKLVNWLIACMLDALSWNDDLYIPRDLIVLIRERLGGSNPEYEQASHAHQMRWAAIMVGGQLQARGIKPSFRMLAGILNVAPSTVKRWFPAGEFAEEVERASHWWDEDGKMRPTEEVWGRPLRRK